MITRRDLVRDTFAASLLLPSVKSMAGESQTFDYLDTGVASGEPTHNSVVIWTRIPKSARENMSFSTIDVIYEVSLTQDFASRKIVDAGVVETSILDDFTVKIKVEGLDPFTTYYYRFRLNNGFVSLTGRTKTAPGQGIQLSKLSFAVMTCQDYASGYFTAYENLIKENVDFCIHLGDYIYEDPNLPNFYFSTRRDDTGKAIDLEQYRTKYRMYLSDPHLREARRLFPFIHIWDDHEILNNYAGGSASDDQIRRSKNAVKAYSEYMPIEHTLDHKNEVVVNTTRTLKFGDNLEVLSTDLRSHKMAYPCRAPIGKACEESLGEEHTMLGKDQLHWLKESLGDSSARWKLMLSSLMFMPFRLLKSKKVYELASQVIGNLAPGQGGVYLNFDAWDGYPAERQEITQFLQNENIENLVICSGDIHAGFSAEIHAVPDDIRSPVVAREMTTYSITSRGFNDVALGLNLEKLGIKSTFLKANPHMSYVNLKNHGYSLVEAYPDVMSIKRIAVDTIRRVTSNAYVTAHEGIRSA